MNLVQITAGELNWLRSLGRKLFRQTPWQVAVGTLVFIVGQLCLLAAFLMPLKVILLVASDGVPLYLAPIVSAERKDDFVLLLAVAAIASYGVYHLCSSVVSRAVASGAQRVQAKARKLHLFSNQEELAEQGYLRFIRCIGSAFIAVLGFAAGALFNPVVFGTLFGVIVVEYGAVALILRFDTRLSRQLAAVLSEKLGMAVGVLSSVNFLVAFAILLVQFLQVEQLSVIVAIVSVILIRQVLQRSAACVQDLAYLSKNRLRLMTLFYTSIQYLPPADKHHNAFLEGLRPEPRNRWLANALSEVVGVALARVHSRWLDTGTPGVAHLDVTAAGQRWFVKYFSHRHSLRAAHEAQLFTTHPDDLPGAPRYLGESFVNGNRLLVLEGLPMEPLKAQNWKRMAAERLLATWSVVPDGELVDAYRRTHSTLPERLDAEEFRHMEVAVETDAEEAVLTTFESDWPGIREHIMGLPLVVRNPAMTGLGNWVRAPDGTPYCLNWNNWGIEPIGAEPLLLQIEEYGLAEALEQWRNATAFSEASAVTVTDLQLVARLVVLEQALRRKSFRKALDTLAEVVEAWHTPAGEKHANTLSVARG